MIRQKKDKANRTIYSIPQRVGYIGLNLYEYEIAYIEQLLTYGIVRGLELNDFASTMRKRARHVDTSVATKSRIKKLREAGLIRSFQAIEQTGYKTLYKTYYSTYTKFALDVLLEIGKIDYEQYDDYFKRLKYIQQNRAAAIPKLHSMATTSLGMKLYVTLTSLLEQGDFSICKGVHHPLFTTRVQQRTEAPTIFPDLLVELPEKVLMAFEIDGGKQGREVILNKVSRYEEFMKSEHMQGYHLRIVFLPIDDELIEEEGRKHVSARISYIKELFGQVYEATTHAQPLDVYCYRFKQVIPHIKTALRGIDHYETNRAEWFANYWSELAIHYLTPRGYRIEPTKMSDVLPHSNFEGYAPHAITKVDHDHRKTNSYHLVYYMYTGHAKSNHIFESIQSSVKGILRGGLDVRILLVYANQVHREADTLKPLESSKYITISATSIEEMEQLNLAEPFELPLYDYSMSASNFSVRRKTADW